MARHQTVRGLASGVVGAVASAEARGHGIEHGVTSEDDSRRVAYILGAVSGMQSCIADGVDGRGSMHWSLLDSWEWMSGQGAKYGLIGREKPSAPFLSPIARAGLA